MTSLLISVGGEADLVVHSWKDFAHSAQVPTTEVVATLL